MSWSAPCRCRYAWPGLLALLLLFPGRPAPALDLVGCPARPHADCAAGLRGAAAVIAASPELVAFDAAIAARTALLVDALGPVGAAAMRFDNAVHRRARARDAYFNDDGTVDVPFSLPGMREMLDNRLRFLRAVEPAPSPGLVGAWQGVNARVVIRALPDARLAVEGGSADPYDIAWTCEFEGEARPGPDGVLVVRQTPDGVPVAFRRDGPVLRVAHLLVDGAPRSPDFCGAAGSLSGALFNVAADTVGGPSQR